MQITASRALAARSSLAWYPLASQRVLPRRALELGYAFRFPTLRPALEDLG